MSKRAEQLATIILSTLFTEATLESQLRLHIHKQAQRAQLITKLIQNFGRNNRPPIIAIKQWLLEYPPFTNNQLGLNTNPLLSPPSQMAPAKNFQNIHHIPTIITLGDLATWLQITPAQLDWLSSQHWPSQADRGSYSHYALKLLDKRSGGKRLIESPKVKLKILQRRLLDHILSPIPYHSCSHGFQRGKSILSYVTPHVHKKVILKFDLADYFLSVDAARIRSLFHRAGYPPLISRKLAALTSTRTQEVPLLQKLPSSWRYQRPHLPQGSPSSPALADKLLYKVDTRLEAFATSMQLNYTRYADDIAFSSEERMTSSHIKWITECVTEMIETEGWYLNHRKTKVMKSSQQQKLAGIVINQTPNLARKEYECLKAILHNSANSGLAANNKDNHPFFYEHLKGRISFLTFLNPSKGEKLHRMLEILSS